MGEFKPVKAIDRCVRTFAFCAKCDESIAWYGTIGSTHVVSILRKRGWSVGKKYIFCPNCRRPIKKKAEQ